MVSQLLFGDAYEITKEKDNWIRIKTCECGYEGWITANLHNPFHEKDVEPYLAAEKYIVRDLLLFIRNFETQITFPIFIGSGFTYPQEDLLILGNGIFTVNLPEDKERHPHPTLTPKQYAILRFASTYLEAPYLWGGRTPAGIDCSALVQLVFKSVRVFLPRDACRQVEYGTTVHSLEEAIPGDVAFFSNSRGEIIHTGIVAGDKQILHASGKVKIDKIDSQGIIIKGTEKYSHQLHCIKRMCHESA